MNRKFLIFGVVLFCQNIIIHADECSVYSCSQLTPDTDKQCTFGNTCESYYTSCEQVPVGSCEIETKVKNIPLLKKCVRNEAGTACELKERVCSEYTATSPIGFECENLPTSTTGTYCITNKYGYCKEESGCPTTSSGCTDHYPLTDDKKWNHLNICKVKGDQCSSEPKLCNEMLDVEKTGIYGELCENLSTSDSLKKKCFGPDSNCEEKFIRCEYSDEAHCTETSNYIEDNNIYKCEYKNDECKKVRKLCSDFLEKTTCEEYIPENTSKKCVFKRITSVDSNALKCHELDKTCAGYSNSEGTKDENICKAIEEDSYHHCVFNSNTCSNTPNKCSDYNSNSAQCNEVHLNETYKCEYDNEENKCIEVRQYENCNLYTGNDRIVCETKITPPETNKRCILKNDKECVSVPKECESYNLEPNPHNEYECINNYKPLDENKKCVFVGSTCQGAPKYEYCSDFTGTETGFACSDIVPKNNGENYSIKCEIKESKCMRVEGPCSDGNNEGPEKCSLIIPKDSKKKCIYKYDTNQCLEEYKTCKDYNDDLSVEVINSGTCTSITSDDGKKCKYGSSTTRGTCTSDEIYKCDATFNTNTFHSACVSIKLSDISKKCEYLNGECTKIEKKCLELVFNGNEAGIEDICKSAEVSQNDKKCIISSDKTHCLEVDSSLIIEEDIKTSEASKEESKNGENNNNPQETPENEPDSGKDICLNTLVIMILCLLF